MFVRRQSSRLLFAAVALLLTAFPLAAQEDRRPVRVCPQPFLDDAGARATLIQPLLPGERLVYGIDRLPAEMLEVRYRVNGRLHLTEVVDLAGFELPLNGDQRSLMRLPLRQSEAGAVAPPRAERVQGVRAIELLTLHPDSARELHRLAREGAVIAIELLQGGSVVETLSFAELTTRAAALADKGYVPVFAPTQVSGPGLAPPQRTLRVARTEYLESCNDCTSSHPCDTECGWDPGKGGPVTCGEQGMPCEPWCAPSFTSGEWWGPWTYHSTSYGFSECFRNYWGGGDRYNQVITTYRRERIRRTTTCPNSPSCTGCYDTEAVINVQYSSAACYENSYYSCAFPETACCWRTKCNGSGFSPCSNSFPCL